MTRTHGWWRRGFPLRAQVPHGHWRTMTFLAALRHDRITAPCVIDGPINGTSFRAYVEFLVPTLSSGDVGTHIGTINTPEVPANLAFGGPDMKTLFFTAHTSVYSMRVKVAGLPGHPFKKG